MKSVNFIYQENSCKYTYISIIEKKHKIVCVDIEVNKDNKYIGDITVSYKNTHLVGVDEFDMDWTEISDAVKKMLIGEALVEGSIFEFPKLTYIKTLNTEIENIKIKFEEHYKNPNI
ncbi:MAG: hypothetical protein WC390_07420 [Sulfurimonas sp.]|jgi:actin-like ATPase involved in cell morphogenesis